MNNDDLETGVHQPTDMWEGWDELTEPPGEDDATSVTQQERKQVDLAEFWQARPSLTLLHEFAKARRVGPWAVLGSALARVVANTPPALVLPPTTGGVASLNMFVGLVGAPGVGKDSAQNVARIALAIQDNGARPPLEAPVGSGEGLAHMFMKPRPKGAQEEGPEQYNTKALVRIGEIDTLAAQQSRTSSTLSSQLRMAAMGEELGAWYVDTTKRMIVPRQKYRLCMVAGIQPTRSGVLLDDADGGTPQRWLWMPAGDPAAQRQVPPIPPGLVWQTPDLMRATRLHEDQEVWYVVDLPDACIEAQIDVRMSGLHETNDRLDAHAMLTRTKVATALALLEQRTNVTDEDWRLSGVIMTVSDGQRARCVKALGETVAVANRNKAVAVAEQTLIVTEVVDQEKRKKLARTIKNKLAKAGLTGETEGKLRNALASADRELFETVIDSLLVSGEIRTEEQPKTVRYWLNLQVGR